MPDPNRPDLSGITAYLSAKDGPRQLDFYGEAFGAEVTNRAETPDGRIMNATLRINDGCLMLSDAFPEYGHPWVPPQGTVLHLQVDRPQNLVGSRNRRRLHGSHAHGCPVLGRPLWPAQGPLRGHMVDRRACLSAVIRKGPGRRGQTHAIRT